ncbi:unnamed protein product [Prorocentrum cordatum]|uniref:Cryptochrome DASH n=1 Tax=Prorocentrum cordatum TaxID=2364126 RepID=A0ABN9PIF7_9DINO|nr:unnamed protein product [Polarella glacialis]
MISPFQGAVQSDVPLTPPLLRLGLRLRLRLELQLGLRLGLWLGLRLRVAAAGCGCGPRLRPAACTTLYAPPAVGAERGATPPSQPFVRDLPAGVADPAALLALPECEALVRLGYAPQDAGAACAPEPRAALDFWGGEAAGLARLEGWVQGGGLSGYYDSRSGVLGADYSSKLSPWLALGCLSPVRVYRRIRREGLSDSVRWLISELGWRDLFRYHLIYHGSAVFKVGGPAAAQRAWLRDKRLFDAWRLGETGIHYVDAHMRELAASGFMSNTGRQLVASFLSCCLGMDWRLGAMWFEATLLDHDVAINYGNWNREAHVRWAGRRSVPAEADLQGEERSHLLARLAGAARGGTGAYDTAEFVRRWVPELRGAAGGGLVCRAAPRPVLEVLCWSCSALERASALVGGKLLCPACRGACSWCGTPSGSAARAGSKRYTGGPPTVHEGGARHSFEVMAAVSIPQRVPSQAGRADGAVAAEHSAAATRDEVLRNRLPALQAVTDAISNLSQPERGRLLLPSGFAAMLDLCDAVREVGDVSSMLGPTWALHQRIDWATAVALHAVPRAREAYQTFLASHVNGHRALLEVHTVFPSVGAGGTQWVTRVREVLKVWEAAHPGYSAEVSGGASQAVDVRDTLMAGMARYLAVIVTIIVFLVYYAFKSVMVPIRLAVALVFTLVATYGTGVIIYQTPLLHPWFPFLRDFNGISYEVIPHVTGIAISLGLDYDIFLVSRVVEFRMSRYTDRASIFRPPRLKTLAAGAPRLPALAEQWPGDLAGQHLRELEQWPRDLAGQYLRKLGAPFVPQ